MKLDVINFRLGDTVLGRVLGSHSFQKQYLCSTIRIIASEPKIILVTIVKIVRASQYVDITSPAGQIFYCYDTDVYDCISRL